MSKKNKLLVKIFAGTMAILTILGVSASLLYMIF